MVSLRHGRRALLVTDDVLCRVFQVSLGDDGEVGTEDDTVAASFDTAAYGNTDPEDVAFDVDTGDCSSATASERRSTGSPR